MPSDYSLSNAEIADRLASLAQLLSTRKENPYKIKAYRRASANIRTLAEGVDQLVRNEADLTEYAGIGAGIAAAIREIVLTGTLGKLEKLKSSASPELCGISAYPRLDPKRVLRIYKKLGISTIEELRKRLRNREIETVFGARMAQHVQQGLAVMHGMLLYRAHHLCDTVQEFLLKQPEVHRATAVGDYRRRVEVIEKLDFLVETLDFPGLVRKIEGYGGRTPLISSTQDTAIFMLSAGVSLRVYSGSREDWGLSLIRRTGNKAHLRKLMAVAKRRATLASNDSFRSEKDFYQKFSLSFIEPELREGLNEVERSANRTLPVLVTADDIRGELHAHSTSSDGSSTIAQMAAAARSYGYDYVGITDHSQSLKIAGGVPQEDLWKQIRLIDQLNRRMKGFRILKSAEVDILADGSLDYADDLLKELDYTVCSIHSRFALNRNQQTDRILRAMDNRHFNILGHATGRLLLKRPGYEVDIDRIIGHAKDTGCFFEINSSPDRLDLSAKNARMANQAGVKIAINTDAHSTGEFNMVICGIEQARRAGLEKSAVLNCLPWADLCRAFKR